MDPDAYLCQLADVFNGISVQTPSISAVVAIVLAGLLLLVSGFASASEIAFFSLSPSDLNAIAERKHPSDEKITMSEEKTTHSKLSEARRRANKKYNDRFVEMKVRVTPEKRSIIKEHAEAMGESATAFINRAIDEAMKRDLSQ